MGRITGCRVCVSLTNLMNSITFLTIHSSLWGDAKAALLGGAGHGLRLSIMIILFYNQSKPQDWAQDATKDQATGARHTSPLSQLKAPAARSCHLPPHFNMEGALYTPFLSPLATRASQIRQEPPTRFVFWDVVLWE